MSEDRITIAEAAELLKCMNRILILMHRNPDGDTIGSAYGLCEALVSMGKLVSVGCCDSIPSMYDYLTERYTERVEEFIPNTFISVDAASLSQLGDYTQFCDSIDLSIDHHGSNTGYAKRNLVEETYASCSEIVYEIVTSMGCTVNEYIGSAIYTGISTDTGCFRYRNTTANSHLVTARLIECGIDLGYLNALLFESKSKEFLRLQQSALSSLRFYFEDRIAVTTITREMFDISGASDEDMTNISPIAKAISGVDVGLTFRETIKGTIKCSVRTSPAVDASALCRLFGGGGHHGSAAFEVSGDMTEVQTLTIARIIETLRAQ